MQSQSGQSQSWTSQNSQSGAMGSGRYGTPQSGSYQNTNSGSYSNSGGQSGQWTGMRPDQSYNGSPNWRPSLDNSTTMSQTTGGMWGSDRNAGAAGRSGQQEWNDRDMTAMSESDLPAVVRTGFTTEANGSALSETGRTTWNGTQAYCAKITRNGHPYKIVTDSDGSLLMMKRLD